jgi:hypothetical protein
LISTTSGWNAKNALMGKTPIYAFAIAGQAVVYTTHSLAAMGITGMLSSYQPWLKVPTGASQTIDIVNGSSSIGDLTCEVIDVGGAIRTLVGANTLEGSAVTLKVGYPGTAWTDFAVLQSYTLYKILPSDGYTSFLFVCRDLQLEEKMTVTLHPENGLPLNDDNPWYLTGTPAEIFQAVVLFALGLSASQVDRATLVTLDSAAENIFGPWRPFRFELTRPFEAKQFLETEVFKPSGLYQVVLPNGALTLRSMRAPAAGASPVFTFTEDNLIDFPKWDRQAIINQAVWQFDSDGGSYQNYETFIQATSVSQYGRGNQFSVDSSGLRTEMGAFAFSEWVSSRLFARFGGVAPGIKGGAPLLTLRAFLMTLPVWVGDYVALTHTKMPDITNGALGVTGRVYEVIDRQPNYAMGMMQYKILDTGLGSAPAGAWQFGAASARPCVIGTGTVY